MATKFYNTPNNKHLRRSLRKNMPRGEKLLWYKLRNKKIGYKFRRQYEINNYIIDFYCIKLKLAIEIDGWTHDFPDQIKKDKTRQQYIESLGIKVKRFYSEEIFENIDDVVNEIYYFCKKLDGNN